MKTILTRSWLMVAIFTLAACSTSPQKPVQSQSTYDWPTHQQYMLEQNQFQAQGKIAIRQQQQRSSATLQWQQQGDKYTIFMAGPFGGGAVTIKGSNQGVMMEISGEGRFFADSPESLMQDRLGWSLPVSNLSYWVKGVPAPGSRYSSALDEADRLLRLKQNNWLIDYQSYHHLEDTDWPRKLQLSYGPDLQVTLLIKNWQHSPALP